MKLHSSQGNHNPGLALGRRKGNNAEMSQNMAISAVLNYTSKFDGARLDSLRVSEQEMRQAYAQVTKDQITAVKLMKQRLVKSELAILKRQKEW